MTFLTLVDQILKSAASLILSDFLEEELVAPGEFLLKPFIPETFNTGKCIKILMIDNNAL